MKPVETYRRHTIYVGEPSERTTCVVGDINGDGVPEIVVGSRRPRAELIWLGRDARGERQAHQRLPSQRLFLNRGGRFEERIIDQGVGTHEAKVIVLDGRAGIAGEPYRNLRSEAPRGPDVDGVHVWLPEAGTTDEHR